MSRRDPAGVDRKFAPGQYFIGDLSPSNEDRSCRSSNCLCRATWCSPEVLADIGTYGKQLGRIGDAMVVLLDHFRLDRALTRSETDAIDAPKEMLAEIDNMKRKHHQGPRRRS